MKFNLSTHTGFTQVTKPQEIFLETLHRTITDPTSDASKGGFSCGTKQDRRIKDLVHKASVAYTVDAMVRQAVDKYAEMFKSFSFEGDPKIVSYLRNRFTQMTLQTGEHWATLITRIIHEYFKTGNAFIVKTRGGGTIKERRPLYKNKPYSISGLSIVSAERLEEYRGKNGEFLGWQISGTKNDAKVSTIVSPTNRLNPNSSLINIPQERGLPDEVLVPGVDIVHIAYKKAADSTLGFGLTLAALEDVSMTRVLEQITSIMMKKFSNPLIWHRITRPSSALAGMQQDLNMAYETWRRMAPDGVLITGGNAEIKAIGAESQALRVEGYLKYFLYRSLAGLGISPYLMGLEGGGQGTVEASIELMMMRTRFCQEEISREIEMFLLNEILWEGGFDPYINEEHQVKLVFTDFDEDKIIKMQNHAADLWQKNFVSLSEGRSIGQLNGEIDDESLYLHRIDIPKVKAEAGAKGDAQQKAGVAIAKAKPSPSKSKKKTKEDIEREIKDIIPNNLNQLNVFLYFMENKYGYPKELLNSLKENIIRLLDDPEAIKILLLESLTC